MALVLCISCLLGWQGMALDHGRLCVYHYLGQLFVVK